MHKPEMILFDYGSTLLYERDSDFLRGERAVFPYIRENPHQKTPEELSAYGTKLFLALRNCRHMGFEINEMQILRCKYDTFGITFTIPLEEVEEILWDNATPGARMPGVEEMLAFLHRRGIRTGVISNLGWTGAALKRRIDQLLPDNHFEFVLVSSEYALRKPHPAMFSIALEKAGLTPDRVWFCGDSMEADVCGAHGAGIYPVLYEGIVDSPSPYLAQNREITVDFDYLHIHHWQEMTDLLATMA